MSVQGCPGLGRISAYSTEEIIFFYSKPEDGLDHRVWLAVGWVLHLVHFDEATAEVLGSKEKSPIMEEAFLVVMSSFPNMGVQASGGYCRVAHQTDCHVVITVDYDA